MYVRFFYKLMTKQHDKIVNTTSHPHFQGTVTVRHTRGEGEDKYEHFYIDRSLDTCVHTEILSD